MSTSSMQYVQKQIESTIFVKKRVKSRKIDSVSGTLFVISCLAVSKL